MATDKRRTSSRPFSPWLGFGLAILTGLGLGGTSGAATGLMLRSEATTAEGSAADSPGLPPEAAPLPFLSWNELDHDMTVLLMGVDATSGEGRSGLRANSDTMLLLRLAPSTNKIYGISLPRDTRVKIPGHSTFKINAAEAWGGPDLAARTVSNFLDLPIHKYLVVSLEGIIKAIDAIGGVDVTIPKAMDYDDWAGRLHIHLKPGLQHLTGSQVEAYLRFRHDEIGSDVARVQRQQGFLMEAGRQFLKPSVVLRLPELWSIIGDHAQTNLSGHELVGIARWARHLDARKDITMTVLPGSYDMIKGVSYWTPDVEAAAPFLDAHFRESSGYAALAANPGRPRVVIWDATGRRPSLKALERELRDDGYVVWAIDRRRTRALTSRVIVQRGDVDGGRHLAAELGMPEVFTAAVGDLNSDFTVELGEDWTGDAPAQTQEMVAEPGIAGQP